MNSNFSSVFSPRRFFLLAKASLLENLRTLLVCGGGIFAVHMTMVLLLCYLHAITPDEHYFVFYSIWFSVFGLIITGAGFKRYYRRPENTFLLTLPASVFEKWLAIFLATGVGWIAFSFAVNTVFDLVSSGLALLFNERLDPRWWLQGGALELYVSYLVSHAVFFLGSSVFKKLAIFKTILCGIGVSCALGIVCIAAVYALFGTASFAPSETEQAVLGRAFVKWPDTLFIILTAAFVLYCWIVSFVRFREIEEKDAV